MKMLIIFFITIYFNFASTKHVDQTWMKGQGASEQSYRSAKPIDYIKIPSNQQQISRDYYDGWLAQDISPYTVGDLTTALDVQDECPMEEYFSMVVTGSSACALASPLGYKTYDTRTPTAPAIYPGRALTWPEVRAGAAGPDDLYSMYAIKMTAGMIYRDRFNCSTSYEHLKYHDDESEYLTPAGELQTVTNGDYCFFHYLPAVNRADGSVTGPYYWRVQEEDEDGKKYIKKGMAPFMPLSNDVRTKIQNDEYGVQFLYGRYMIPMPQGQMVLPHNGLNLFYNRYVTSRPYHQVRVDKKVTKSSGLLWIIAAIVVGVLTFGVGFAVAGAITVAVVATAVAAATVTAILLYEPGSTWSYAAEGGGKKTEPWGNQGTAGWPPYMCLQPETNPKKFPAMFFAFNLDFEQGALTQALSGNMSAEDADGNPVSVPLNGDATALSSTLPTATEVQAFLTPERMFQFWTKSAYDMDAGGGTTVAPTPSAVIVPATDPSVADAWLRYKPLYDDLEAYWAAESIPSGSGALATYLDSKKTDTSATISAGGRNFSCSSAYKNLATLLNTHRNLITELEAAAVGDPRPASCPAAVWPQIVPLLTSTVEGAALANYAFEIEAGQKQMDMVYSQKWFETSSPTEAANLRDKAGSLVSSCGGSYPFDDTGLSTCLSGGDGTYPGFSTTLSSYNMMEAEPAVAGPFGYYTTQTGEGQEVLGILGLMQDFEQGTTVRTPYSKHLKSSYRCSEVPSAAASTIGYVSCLGSKFPALQADPEGALQDLDQRYSIE